MNKILFFTLTVLAICSLGSVRAFAVVTDNADILHVPIGETYTLDGVHAYNLYVNIEGTLTVTAYNGSGTTGTLELSAPEIDISGTIDADGKGFRRNEGPGRSTDSSGGAGAGYGGKGGNSGHGGIGGPAYGTASGSDIEKGSGGADGSGGGSGGRGGGSVILNGELVSVSGTVIANGKPGGSHSWAAGGGSGGGILIYAFDVSVGGSLSVKGGKGGNGTWAGGGAAGGRIKIFYGSLNTAGSTITYGGGNGGTGSWNGGAGQSGTYHTGATAFETEDFLWVPPGATYTMHGSHYYKLYVNIEGTLTVTDYNETDPTGTLELKAPMIDVSGTIDADGAGFRNYEGPGRGVESLSGGGAGYGGKGGNSGHGGTGGPTYGTTSGPDIEKGSGGAEAARTGFPGGSGGGCVVLDGRLISISGAINANGEAGTNHDWAAGGGSGGGVLIRGNVVDMTGSKLSVRGGNGGNGLWAGGGGGGGRIKIFYCTLENPYSSVIYSRGNGGTGTFPGSRGNYGTYFTACDCPPPWREYNGTYAYWEFGTNDPNPPADEWDNPYGEPNLTVTGLYPTWWFSYGYPAREGIWYITPYSGTIKVKIPNRPGSGPQSMKVIWVQIEWTLPGENDPITALVVTETGSGLEIPAAKYPDVVFEEPYGTNWRHSTFVIMPTPNPDSEEITIEGWLYIDNLTIETKCITGFKTGDLNGDGEVNALDYCIFAEHWLDGVGP